MLFQNARSKLLSYKAMTLRLKFAGKPSAVQFITIKFVQKRGTVKVKTGVYPESFQRTQCFTKPRPLLNTQSEKIAARDGENRSIIMFGGIQKTRETTGADHRIVAARSVSSPPHKPGEYDQAQPACCRDRSSSSVPVLKAPA